MKKAVLGLALIAPVIAGCLDEGRIDFNKDKIEVTITDDTSGNMEIWASWFLHVERNAENRSDFGMKRPIIFNGEGLTPAACTEGNNCSTGTMTISLAGDAKPKIIGPHGEPDKQLLISHHRQYIWNALVEDDQGSDLSAQKEARLDWVATILDRINVRLVAYTENDNYADHIAYTHTISPSTSTNREFARRVMQYGDLRLFKRGDCNIEEWLNVYAANDGCDGSDWDFESRAQWKVR
jgi:hypothetical protein